MINKGIQRIPCETSGISGRFFEYKFVYIAFLLSESSGYTEGVKNFEQYSAKHMKKIVETAEYYNHEEAKKADKKIDDKNGYDYYHVAIGLKNGDTYNVYKGTLVLRISSTGKRFAYDIINMSAAYGTQIEKRSGKKPSAANKPTVAQSDQTINNNIRKKSKNDTGNIQFSLNDKEACR